MARLDGFTTSLPRPTAPCNPSDPAPTAAGSLRRWMRWDGCRGIGSRRCAASSTTSTRNFSCSEDTCCYSGTEWALSSINQHGLWEKRPILDRDGHISVLSVDIGDFNTPSSHLVDEFGRGKAARDCTADEIAAEVWRQIISALTSDAETVAEEVMPWPVWYALDRGLVMAAGPGQGQGRVVRNESPYLVPIVGDWPNRPGGDPWNPHGTSWTTRADRGLVARRSRAARTSGRPAMAATRCTTTRWSSPARGPRRSPG